jgi:hypothetical protein
MQRLMDVADKVDQERQIAGSAPAVVPPLFQALRILVDFAVTQFPLGHRPGTSTRRSVRQMSMKCQAAVEGSSSRNSTSEATSIAVAIVLRPACTPRMFCHVASCRRTEVIRRYDRDDSVPIISPAPCALRREQNRQSYARESCATTPAETMQIHQI